jgi:hypothetical protein
MEGISPISFLTAVVVTNEILVGIIIQHYKHLKILLKEYNTAQKWTESKYTITALSIHYPHLNIINRTSAIRDMRKYSELFEELTHQNRRVLRRLARNVPF